MDRKRWSFPQVGVAAARVGGEVRIALAGVAPIPWLLGAGRPRRGDAAAAHRLEGRRRAGARRRAPQPQLERRLESRPHGSAAPRSPRARRAISCFARCDLGRARQAGRRGGRAHPRAARRRASRRPAAARSRPVPARVPARGARQRPPALDARRGRAGRVGVQARRASRAADARGLMQIVPTTAAELKLDVGKPATNVLAGARYLQADARPLLAHRSRARRVQRRPHRRRAARPRAEQRVALVRRERAAALGRARGLQLARLQRWSTPSSSQPARRRDTARTPPKQQVLLPQVLDAVGRSAVDGVVVVAGAHPLDVESVAVPRLAARPRRVAALRARRAARRGRGRGRRPRRRAGARPARDRPRRRGLAGRGRRRRRGLVRRHPPPPRAARARRPGARVPDEGARGARGPARRPATTCPLQATSTSADEMRAGRTRGNAETRESRWSTHGHSKQSSADESPLAHARLHRQLTVDEAARRASVSADEVQWLEEGRLYRFPTPDRALTVALLYATALGIDHREALELAGPARAAAADEPETADHRARGVRSPSSRRRSSPSCSARAARSRSRRPQRARARCRRRGRSRSSS